MFARRVLLMAGLISVSCIYGSGLLLAENTKPKPYDITPATPAERVNKIIGCILDSGEVLLEQTKWTCVERGAGHKQFKDNFPISLGPDPCPASASADLRRLDSSVIRGVYEDLNKRKEHKQEFSPEFGLRLIGGLYCREELDLSDLELPYALVLDHSYFKFGIRARKFQTAEYLSVDNGIVRQNLTLINSKIVGSFYGDHAFIEKLRFLETDIGGSLKTRQSILYSFALLDRSTMLGALEVSYSALSSLIVRRSKIGERIALNGSRARCAYNILNSEVGEIYAKDFGFGKVISVGEKIEPRKAWIDLPTKKVRKLFESRAVKAAIIDAEIKKWNLSKAAKTGDPKFELEESEACRTNDAEFLLIQSKLHALCVMKFQWLRAGKKIAPSSARSLITIVDTSISDKANLNIPIARQKSEGPRRTLKLIGVNIDTLHFDFDFVPISKNDELFVDNIAVNHVYNKRRDCPRSPQPLGYSSPVVGTVVNWLSHNKAATTQPYLAFFQAFQKAGTNANELKIAKAEIDLENDVSSRLATIRELWNKKLYYDEFKYIFSLSLVVDTVRLTLSWIGGHLADFGLRPEKAIVIVFIIVVVFYFVIKRILGIAHGSTDSNNENPDIKLGLFFVFDYMIPGYSINASHGKITQYFYSDGTIVGGRTRVWLDYILLALKLFGIIATIFIAAALKSLVTS